MKSVTSNLLNQLLEVLTQLTCTILQRSYRLLRNLLTSMNNVSQRLVRGPFMDHQNSASDPREFFRTLSRLKYGSWCLWSKIVCKDNLSSAEQILSFMVREVKTLGNHCLIPKEKNDHPPTTIKIIGRFPNGNHCLKRKAYLR